MQFKIFFGLLLLIIGVIAVLMALPAPQDAIGFVHPTFRTMMHGGESIVFLPTNKWLALVLGLSVVCVFGLCVAISVQKEEVDSNRSTIRRVVLGSLLYLLALVVLFALHFQVMDQGDLLMFGGFPRDTAWMLFVFSLVPVFFTIYYVVKFDTWVISDQGLEKFKSLVDGRNKTEN